VTSVDFLKFILREAAIESNSHEQEAGLSKRNHATYTEWAKLNSILFTLP